MQRNDIVRIRPATGPPFVARVTYIRERGDTTEVGYATEEHGGLAMLRGSIVTPPITVEVIGHHAPTTKRRRTR